MENRVLLSKSGRPESSIVWGYLGYTLVGVILLSIPWFRKYNINVIDNLFVTVSAISTTGLATISIPDSYSILGQIVIIFLIQFGGIGYMTFGSFIILSTRRTLSDNRQTIHKTAFSLPKDFSIKKFIKSIVVYTIIIEFIGAIFLTAIFWGDERANPIWSGIFHSISAFCTAGFSLYNNSLELYADNIYLNTVISILSFLGAIGYIVMVDVWLIIRGKKRAITFTSKIILMTTFILFTLGVLFLFFESSLKTGIHSGNFLHSCFQSMSALTTVGFNTVAIGEFRSFSLFILIILMIVGASPSGTGGGIKSTTVSSILGVIKSVFSYNKEYINYHIPSSSKSKDEKKSKVPFFEKIYLSIFGGKKLQTAQPNENIGSNEDQKFMEDELNKVLGDVFKIKLMGRAIPFDRVIHSIATFAFYFIILFIGVQFLLLTESFSFEQIFFEAASGLGTVGLSTGITGDLSVAGKVIVIFLMFIGRLGPITFGLFLFSRRPKEKPKSDNEDLVI